MIDLIFYAMIIVSAAWVGYLLGLKHGKTEEKERIEVIAEKLKEFIEQKLEKIKESWNNKEQE